MQMMKPLFLADSETHMPERSTGKHHYQCKLGILPWIFFARLKGNFFNSLAQR